jgi:DNA polymerase I-like protein with 3'-5' exonuclease and polymerase domains
MPITKLLIETETWGVKLDKNKLKELKKEAWVQVEESEREIYKEVGYQFDVGSAKQLAKLLFEERKIGMSPDGETNKYSHRGKTHAVTGKIGEWSTGKNILEAMRQDGIELAGMLLKFRSINTRLNTFIRPLLDRCKGKNNNCIIYPSFIQIGTVSGRFASKNPNYQNLPRKGGIRKSFIARPGYKIVKADYCVAEGTKIELSTGTTSIEKVLPGSKVILENGETATVAEVIDRGVLPVVTLKTKRGFELTATKLHRIRIINKAGNYVWKRIGELDSTDRIAIQPGCGGVAKIPLPKIEFNHHNNNQFNYPRFVNSEIAELFGYLCGDGCFQTKTGSSYVSVIVCDEDKVVIERVDYLLKKYFEGCHVQYYQDDGSIVLKISSKPLAVWCKNLGLSKNGVPRFLWRAKTGEICSFLRGYFEADGSIGEKSNGQRISAASSRLSLIKDIQGLLLKVGIVSTNRKAFYIVKGKKFVGWQIAIPTINGEKFQRLIGFIGSRKKRQLDTYLNYTNRCPSLGGFPNLKDKVRALGLSGEIRRLLNNTASLDRDVSLKLAQQIKDESKDVYNHLELYRTLDFGTFFDKIESITERGEKHVYDLSVPGPMTYISNGFVSHNSQAELRLMSHMSRDPVMMEIYRNNGDIHQVTADACGVTRQAAKAINFGLIYRMSAARLQAQLAAQDIHFTIEDCYRFVKRYFKKYRKVREYHKRVEKVVMQRLDQNGEYGWIKTLGGRYRRLDSQFLTSAEHSYKAITQAINTTIQGGVSDLIKVAMVECQNVFKKNMWLNPEEGIWDACIQGQVHDEIFVECKESFADKVAEILQYSMVNTGKKYNIAVPMLADTEIVDSLAKS